MLPYLCTPTSYRISSRTPIALAVAVSFCLPPAFALDMQAINLDPVRVTSHAEALQQYNSYQPLEVTGPLGMPADPMEIPVSVSVITPLMLEDIGATRMDHALNYISGVAMQNEFGGLWDNYSIRGFSGDINRGPVFLRDGVRANRGYTGKQDAANLERVEVLKGPASALVGRTDPGGTVNIVTKRPRFEKQGEITLSGSTERPTRSTLDVTGPLSDTFAGRLNLAIENGDTFRDKVRGKRYLIAPAMTWKPSSSTRLHYDGEFVRQETPLDRGVVSIDNDPSALPVSRFLGEPNDGPIVLETLANRIRLIQDISSEWTAQFTLAHINSQLKGYSSEPFGASVEAQRAAGVPEGMLSRERRHRDYESDDIVGVVELRGSTQLAGKQHYLLFGLEVSDYSQDFDMRRSRPYSGSPNDLYLIDIKNPTYGAAPLPAFDERRRIFRKDAERTAAFYAQDMLYLRPDLRLIAGLRFDQFKQSSTNQLTGQKSSQTDRVLSPRLGLSFDVTPEMSVYGNISRSFDPNSGADRYGNQFDPEKATSFEVGVKSLLGDGRVTIDVALFHITKKNVLTRDPVDPAYFITAGKVKSRGFELDLNGALNDHWRMSLSYAFVDAQIQADGVSYIHNTRLLNVPKNSASLLTNYEIPLSNGHIFGIGSAIVYMGERVGNQNDPDFKLPSYTTVQTRSYYRPQKNVEISLQIDNLFDRKYYRSSYWQNWVTPGAPRTFTAQARYHF